VTRRLPTLTALVALATAIAVAGLGAWRTATAAGWLDAGYRRLVRNAFWARFDPAAGIALAVVVAPFLPDGGCPTSLAGPSPLRGAAVAAARGSPIASGRLRRRFDRRARADRLRRTATRGRQGPVPTRASRPAASCRRVEPVTSKATRRT
jgi:hypothetical protein